MAEEFQSWALCERVCAESTREASRQMERSRSLARLAKEIAERVPGAGKMAGSPPRLRGSPCRQRLTGGGDLKGAEAAFESAKRLWHDGADPGAVLDPGRLSDQEASLRRDQRRFSEALALLDEAFVLGRSPARVLIKKGFTLEVMGEYERSIEALLQAKPLVESQGDQRLRNMLHCNLGFTLCHVDRFAEAAELAREVRASAAETSTCSIFTDHRELYG